VNHLKEVKSKLMQRGWTQEDFDSMLCYKPSYFRQRVALLPRQMHYRVRAVFVCFGNRKDSRKQTPLFNERAERKANNILREILKGWYSDSPDWNFYYNKLDKTGTREKDKYGILLIRSRHVTSLVENVRRQYNAQFRHICGIVRVTTVFAGRKTVQAQHRRGKTHFLILSHAWAF
jgi:translation initiation factor 2 beta subunit (eIF-2beta)/eIF-5